MVIEKLSRASFDVNQQCPAMGLHAWLERLVSILEHVLENMRKPSKGHSSVYTWT